MINPELFLQIDIITPLRLSPKAFIQRQDENYFLIGIVDQPNARKFLVHILSAIYSFSDWVVPQDLMLMWPQDTVNDLLKILISLRKEKVLLNEEEYNTVVAELTLETTIEEKDYLNDTVWLEKWSQAIKTIPDHANVLNFGSRGAGYLALEIAKGNANKIVATTQDLANHTLAKYKARSAYLNNLDFLYSKTHSISSICYSEPFNVFITELFCSGIFEDKVLEAVMSAKKELLTTDCLFIPSRMDLKIFAFETDMHRDMVQESKEFEILYGFDFTPFSNAISRHMIPFYARLKNEELIKLSDDYTIKSFDFATMQTPYFNENFYIEITKPGKVCGFCTYFELQLTPDLTISNSPFEPKTTYVQRSFSPAASIYGHPGDKIKLKAYYDNNYRVVFAD